MILVAGGTATRGCGVLYLSLELRLGLYEMPCWPVGSACAEPLLSFVVMILHVTLYLKL